MGPGPAEDNMLESPLPTNSVIKLELKGQSTGGSR